MNRCTCLLLGVASLALGCGSDTDLVIGVQIEAILDVGDHPLDDLEGARGAGLQALLLDRDREEMHVPFISSLRDVLKVLSLGDR